MKKYFNLYQMSANQLKNGESKKIKGGSCVCTCAYMNCGGSSTNNNGNANSAQGLESKFFYRQC